MGIAAKQNKFNGLKSHAAAELFPMMTKKEIESLADDIKENGLLVPIVLHEGLILDGRNRLRACELAEAEPRFKEWNGSGSPISWVLSINAKRRHLTPSQIACLAVEALPLFEAEIKERESKRKSTKAKIPESEKGQARDKIAKDLHVSARYIQDAKKLKSENNEVFHQVASGETTIHRAMRNLKKEAYRKKREFSEDHVERSIENLQLLVGDLKVAGKEIKDGSIDVIITDPPYPKEFLSLYGDLGNLAERVLKPGGSLFIMSGHSYLPEVLNKLIGKKLNYHWTLCYLTEGAEAVQLWKKKVLTYWKPILWFTKGEFKGDWSSDVIRSSNNDKRYHKWGQSEAGMADLIERYTLPNQLILDPFLGGGTTGVASIKLGRRFIGIDVDEEAVEISKQRIFESCKSK